MCYVYPLARATSITAVQLCADEVYETEQVCFTRDTTRGAVVRTAQWPYQSCQARSNWDDDDLSSTKNSEHHAQNKQLATARDFGIGLRQ